MNSQVVSQIDMHGLYKTIIYSHEEDKTKTEYEFCPDLWNYIKGFLKFKKDRIFQNIMDLRCDIFQENLHDYIFNYNRPENRKNYLHLIEALKRKSKYTGKNSSNKKDNIDMSILIKFFKKYKTEALPMIADIRKRSKKNYYENKGTRFYYYKNFKKSKYFNDLYRNNYEIISAFEKEN
jgi:hypothetical protein